MGVDSIIAWRLDGYLELPIREDSQNWVKRHGWNDMQETPLWVVVDSNFWTLNLCDDAIFDRPPWAKYAVYASYTSVHSSFICMSIDFKQASRKSIGNG